MNTLDYLLYTAINPTQPAYYPGKPAGTTVAPGTAISMPYGYGHFGNIFNVTVPQQGSPPFYYLPKQVQNFMAFTDNEYIDNAIVKHWNDIIYGARYGSFANFGNQPSAAGGLFQQNKGEMLPYHLIYAYMLENSRIVHIFEKLIKLFYEDETLTKPDGLDVSQLVFNTEKLFYDDSGLNANASIISNVRPDSELVRRNAYFRMFGLGINWGDYKNKNAKVEFHKAQFSNNSFVATFESYLSEFWKAYTNIKNTSGPNSTDLQNLKLIAQLLREQLMARRSNDSIFTNANYGLYTLSKEEVSSCIFLSWLHYIVSYNSPLIKFLRCEANSAGDRLINLGNKVDLPAHSKSVALFDLAHPLAVFLRSFEVGIYENSTFVNNVLNAYPQGQPPTAYAPVQDSILKIIDNWELATGRSVKGDVVIPNNNRSVSVIKNVRIEKGHITN